MTDRPRDFSQSANRAAVPRSSGVARLLTAWTAAILSGLPAIFVACSPVFTGSPSSSEQGGATSTATGGTHSGGENSATGGASAGGGTCQDDKGLVYDVQLRPK